MQKERKRKRHKNKRREEGGNRKNKTITTLRTWSKFKFELSENSIEQESAYYRFTSLKVKSDGDEIKSNLKIVLNTCIRVPSRSVAWRGLNESDSESLLLFISKPTLYIQQESRNCSSKFKCTFKGFLQPPKFHKGNYYHIHN